MAVLSDLFAAPVVAGERRGDVPLDPDASPVADAQGVDGRPLDYAAQDARGVPLRYEEHWVQMGAQPGADGERHGGTPVLLKDGVIEKGPGKFVGKRPGEISKRGRDLAEREAKDTRPAHPAPPPPPARKAAYNTPWEQFRDEERAKEVKKTAADYDAQIADARHMLRRFQNRQDDPHPEELDLIARNISAYAGVEPSRLYAEKIDELEKGKARRVGQLTRGEAWNFEAALETKHAQAVVRAAKEGKHVPDEILVRYAHTDGMPEAAKVRSQRYVAAKRAQESAVAFEKTPEAVRCGEEAAKWRDASRVRATVVRAAEAADRRAAALDEELAANRLAATVAFDRMQEARDRAASRPGGSRDVSLLPDDDPDRVAYYAALDTFSEHATKETQLSDARAAVLDAVRSAAWDAVAPDGAKTAVSWEGDVLPPNTKEAAAFLSRVLGASAFGDSASVSVKILGEHSYHGPFRAYADGTSIHVRADESVRTIVHEVGHILEGRANLTDVSKAFLLRQSPTHHPTRHLGDHFEAYEVFRPDHLIDEYAGKWYDYKGTEILSMGLEHLYADPVGFARRAPEQFDYTVAVIRGMIKGVV